MVATFEPIRDIVLTKRPPSPTGNLTVTSSPVQPTCGSSIYLRERESIQRGVSFVVTRPKFKMELSSLVSSDQKMEKVHGKSTDPKIRRPGDTWHEPRHYRSATYSY